LIWVKGIDVEASQVPTSGNRCCRKPLLIYIKALAPRFPDRSGIEEMSDAQDRATNCWAIYI
jgi:hypothetical protein